MFEKSRQLHWSASIPVGTIRREADACNSSPVLYSFVYSIPLAIAGRFAYLYSGSTDYCSFEVFDFYHLDQMFRCRLQYWVFEIDDPSRVLWRGRAKI